jgi:3,4-dihydroxy 2-butanone 4-phosphate synthase / GTP cyclohydrolase II
MHNHSDLAGRNLSVPEAIRAVQEGRMVLMRDDESRENEADVCLAAQFATPERLNFLLHHVWWEFFSSCSASFFLSPESCL